MTEHVEIITATKRVRVTVSRTSVSRSNIVLEFDVPAQAPEYTVQNIAISIAETIGQPAKWTADTEYGSGESYEADIVPIPAK